MTKAILARPQGKAVTFSLNGASPHIERETIILTPDLAKTFLESNTENRPITETRVSDYARQIMAGLWKYNPGDAALSFDVNGRLLNGQHRCYAVIAADTSITVDVVRGLATDLREVFDTGRARRPADVLAMQEEKGSNLLAAMAAIQLRHLQGMRRMAAGFPYRLVSGGRYAPTNQEIVYCVSEYPRMRESFAATRGLEPRRLMQPAIAAWIHFRLSEIDAAKADEFWAGVATGLDIPPASPIYALRRNLLNRIGTRGSASTKEQEAVAAITLKTWNLWLVGGTQKISVYRPDAEPFPQPLTLAQASAAILREQNR